MAVTNPYYEFDPSFIPGTKARSEDVNVQYQNIQNAFDLLPGSSDALTTGMATFAPESGSGNAYVVTMPDTRIAEADGDEIVFFATHTNTAAATINVDGLGAKAIVTATGVALAANDLLDGIAYTVRYDATNTRYQLMTPNASYLVDSQAAAVAAAADAVAAAASAVEAMQWAVNPEDDDVDSNPGEFSAYHWAQKALGAATTNRLVADITTATPPTNENVTAQLQYWDADETDQLAYIGYENSSALQIRNLMHGSTVEIWGENNIGTPFQFFDADPDNDVYVTAPVNLYLRYGGSVAVDISSSGGVQINHQGVLGARSASRSIGGFQAYNDKSHGSTGVVQRVLTEADYEAGQFRLYYDFTTSITATDPGQTNFKFNNSSFASVTDMYINDTSEAFLDSSRVLTNLADGDILRICNTADESEWIVLEIGVPVDNTGWWTIPVTVLSSNGTNFASDECIIDVQWNSTATAISPTSIYYAGIPRLTAEANGAELLGNANADTNTSVIYYSWANGTDRAFTGFSGTDTFYITSQVHGGNVNISSENLSGNLRDGVIVDPDVGVQINHTADNTVAFSSDSDGIFVDGGAVLMQPFGSGFTPTATANVATIYGAHYTGSGDTAVMMQQEDGIQYSIGNYREVLYAYNSPTTATDPTASLFHKNNALIASTTALYFNDFDLAANDQGWFFSMLAVGDVLMLHQGSNRSNWMHAEVTSVTDNTGWWTVGVTVLDSNGTTWPVADTVAISVDRQSISSGITATPTPAATEVAVWDSTGATLAGSSDFIISTTTFRGANVNAGAILNEAASATNPTLIPNRSDVNTGIGSNAGEQVSIICNGVEVVRVVDSGVNEYAEIIGTLFITEQADAHTDISGDGQIWVRNYAPNQLWFTNDVGDDYPVATARANQRQNTASDMGTAAVAREMINAMCFFDNSTAYTITLEGSSSTEFPVESSFQILNGDLTSPGTITITEGATTTLIYIQPDGTPVDTAGGCTMSTGVATVYRSTAAVYYIWGSGITA